MKLLPRIFCVLACTAAFGAVAAAGQTAISATSSGNTGAAPNGIAVTPTELLFTQPFCAGNQTRGIYSENLGAGTSSLVSTIPETGTCAENYLAISTGLGGFTAGDTYTTGSSTTMPSAGEVFKNGSTAFINPVPNSPQGHVGITFDTVGTFGNDLIVTAQGAVMGYNSAGVLQFSYPTPAGSMYSLEGAQVAPLSFTSCPGCLFVTATLTSNINSPTPSGNGVIFTVPAGAPSGTPLTMWSTTPGPEPEGLVFVTSNNLSCSLSGYSYFVSGYAADGQKENGTATNGAILAWTPAQLTPVVGQILVPDEQGTVYAFSGPNASTVFASTNYQLEGSTILPCPTANGCPATFGFWKHHPFPSSMFVSGKATIGCQMYTSAQLLAVLNQNNAGGNAVTILGHQLIAAIANYAAGGRQTAAATAAISAASALLCNNNLNLSTSFVASGSALGQQLTALANTLDNYNSSGSSCEGNGLTLGTP